MERPCDSIRLFGIHSHRTTVYLVCVGDVGGKMLHYKYVEDSLSEAIRTLRTALKCTCDSEQEKTALEESLALTQQARQKCRLAQAETLKSMFNDESTDFTMQL